MKRIVEPLLFILLVLILFFFLANRPFSLFHKFLPLILFVSLFFWLLSEEPTRLDGIILSFSIGFLYDLFSLNSIGKWLLIFTLSSILIKSFIHRYVWIPRVR